MATNFNLPSITIDTQDTKKGTLFMRSFPYIFALGDKTYMLSHLYGKYNAGNAMNCDLRMYGGMRQNYLCQYGHYSEPSFFIGSERNIIHSFDLKSEVPLYLFCNDDEPDLDIARTVAMQYYELVCESIDRIQRLSKNEDTIIDILLGDSDIRKHALTKIDFELSLVGRDRPDIIESFVHWNRFRSLCKD